MKRRPDPLLRTQPWRIWSVWQPVERIIDRIELEGVVDAAGGVPVFQENSGWYEVVPALQGIIEFHVHAQARYGLPCEVSGLAKLAKKLDAGAPLFSADIAGARASMASCWRQAMQLRVSQAIDLVRTVQISMALDQAKGAAC